MFYLRIRQSFRHRWNARRKPEILNIIGYATPKIAAINVEQMDNILSITCFSIENNGTVSECYTYLIKKGIGKCLYQIKSFVKWPEVI